jgi:glycine/D-amino acid oxidase-like deaminating enzyme/nitrite reductase/ring-hydroxylating ferredoxin subunit
MPESPVPVERNPSLWVSTTSAPSYPTLAQDIEADVVVVGSGITGLSTARLLAGHGLRVVVLEARKLCFGVTGYTTAKVTALHSAIYSELSQIWGDETAAVYAAANQAGIAKVRDLVAADGIECDLREASAYTYAESQESLSDIEAEVDAARRAGLDVSFTTETELPYEIQGAVRLDGQAQFHPRRYCLGLARALIEDGGLIFENSPAVALDPEAATVRTKRATAKGNVVVVATQIPFVMRGGHFARMTPSRSYALAMRPITEPIKHMYISVDQPTRSLRSTGDGYLIVGGEGHPVGTDEDTTKRYDALESWANERFPGAGVDYRWSAQDYRSADWLPFIGRLAYGTDRVFVATGFAKWGMTNGTVAAMIISDLIQDTPNSWADTFDSTRIALQQGGRAMLTGGIEVAKHLVGDRIKSLDRPAASELKPGEGNVVSWEGRKVAAFRDEDGTLHAVSATCTHMGCQVSFNTAERSWDCPCHGSRFDLSGRVLQGPAIKDLATKDSESEATTAETLDPEA